MKILITENQYHFLNEEHNSPEWTKAFYKLLNCQKEKPSPRDYGAPEEATFDLYYFEEVKKWMNTTEYQRFKSNSLTWFKTMEKLGNDFDRINT